MNILKSLKHAKLLGFITIRRMQYSLEKPMFEARNQPTEFKSLSEY